MGVPLHDFLDWREQQRAFEELAAFYSSTVNIGDTGHPERFSGGFMTANSFRILGVQALLGRAFRDGDDAPGATPVIILGHDAWRNGECTASNGIRSPKAMKKFIISVLAVAGMILTTVSLSAQQQSGESRVLDAASRALAVESVASVVEVNYPWPDTAQMIAAHVRERHASSAYDTIPTLRDLANALTRDLRAINGDLHLGVSAGSSGGPGMMASGPANRPTGIDRFERLDGNVGYLKLNLLAGDGAFDAVAQALDSLDGTDAMILDLRAVPGGTTQMGQFLLSHFMPPEVHYLTALSMATGEATDQRTLSEVPGPRRLDVPLYVLVDRGSASAAEAPAFVLQNFGRATIVGERTAGAGRNVVQFPAELGLRVSLSTTRVYDPSSGREWERIGVLPDIVTTSGEALTAALEHARAVTRVTARSRDRPIRAG